MDLKRMYERIERVFALAYIALSIVYYVPTLMPIVDKAMDIMAVLAVPFILVRLFMLKDDLNKYSLLLVAFIACYGVTILVNGLLVDDIKCLLYLSMTLLFFFELGRSGDSKTKNLVDWVVFAITFVGGVISLALFFMGISLHVSNWELLNAGTIIGVHPNGSLYGIIGNSNRMSWLCIIGMFCATSIFLRSQKKWCKALMSADILMQVVLVVLSNSRGGFLGMASYLAILSWAIGQRSKRKVLMSFVLTVSTVALLFIMQYAIANVRAMLYETGVLDVHMLTSTEAATDSQTSERRDEEKRDEEKRDEEKRDTLTADDVARTAGEKNRTVSARVDAYIGGLKIFIDHPIWGIGRENIVNTTPAYIPPDSLLVKYGDMDNLHSIYVTLIVSSGIVGTTLLIVFFGFGLKDLIAVRKRITGEEIAAVAFLVAMLVVNLFESEILYKRTFMCVLFWFYTGVLVSRVTVLIEGTKSRPKHLKQVKREHPYTPNDERSAA